MLLTISAEYAGKKRGKAKQTKQDHVCVHTWRSGFVNHQEQIILRAIEKKKKKKKINASFVSCYLLPCTNCLSRNLKQFIS